MFAHRRVVMMVRSGFDEIRLRVARFLSSICVITKVAGFCEPLAVKIGSQSLVQGVVESEVVGGVDFWIELGVACQK